MYHDTDREERSSMIEMTEAEYDKDRVCELLPRFGMLRGGAADGRGAGRNPMEIPRKNRTAAL